MPLPAPRRVQPPRAAKSRVAPGAYAVVRDRNPNRRDRRAARAGAPGVLDLPDDVLELVARRLAEGARDAVADYMAFASTCGRLADLCASIRWGGFVVDLAERHWRLEVAALRRACCGLPEILDVRCAHDDLEEEVVLDATRRIVEAWERARERERDASGATSALVVSSGRWTPTILQGLGPIADSFARLDCSRAAHVSLHRARRFSRLRRIELPVAWMVSEREIAAWAAAFPELESISFAPRCDSDADLAELAGLERLEAVRLHTREHCGGHFWSRSASVPLGDATLSLLRGPGGRRLRSLLGDFRDWFVAGRLWREDVAEAIASAPALRSFSLRFDDARLARAFAERMLGERRLESFSMRVSDAFRWRDGVAALAAVAERCGADGAVSLCLEVGPGAAFDPTPIFRAIGTRRSSLFVSGGTCVLGAEACAALAGCPIAELALHGRALVPDAAAAAALLEAARAFRARGRRGRIEARLSFRDPAIVEPILAAVELLRELPDQAVRAVWEEEEEEAERNDVSSHAG